MVHNIVKPEVLAGAAVVLLEENLLVPNTFQKESIDRFKGARNDTINIKVPGNLRARDFAWRDHSSPVVYDTYSEHTVQVSFQGHPYSAVELEDEQVDFDNLTAATPILGKQARAVGRDLQRQAVATLEGAPYAVTIGGAEANLRGALIEARRVMNAFRVPDEERILLVGSNFESALLLDDKLNLAQNVGDNIAASVLTQATIGRRFGFTIIVDQTIDPDSAYAYVRSAFVFLNGAPYVPNSVPFGATASYEGVALRWIRDYDAAYLVDRSVVDCYAGFREITDIFEIWDAGNRKEQTGAEEHFVRGIKLTLDGVSAYPDAEDDAELVSATGVSTPWVATP